MQQAVDSWIEKLDVADLRPLLSALFSRYVDPTLEYCRRNFKYVVPIPAISQVMSICKILESILPQVCLPGCYKQHFACLTTLYCGICLQSLLLCCQSVEI